MKWNDVSRETLYTYQDDNFKNDLMIVFKRYFLLWCENEWTISVHYQLCSFYNGCLFYPYI